MLNFLKSRSKVTVKVTREKFMVPLERPCHKEHMPNMKALSHRIKKLRPCHKEHMPNMKALSHRIKKLLPMLKFFKSR